MRRLTVMRFARSLQPVCAARPREEMESLARCRGRTARLIQSLALAALVGAGVASAAGRVVGGTMIQIQSAPWTVFVTYHFGSTGAVCTGSVLDASHILTAAHCLYDPSGILAQPSSVSVQAGVSNFAS